MLAQPLDAVPADGAGSRHRSLLRASDRTRPVAWAGAGRTGPTDGDRLARTNRWSQTFGMMSPLVNGTSARIS
jgi:hypothetical protein